MNKRIKTALISFLILYIILCSDITYTTKNKSITINNLFSVVFTEVPLIEKKYNKK